MNTFTNCFIVGTYQTFKRGTLGYSLIWIISLMAVLVANVALAVATSYYLFLPLFVEYLTDTQGGRSSFVVVSSIVMFFINIVIANWIGNVYKACRVQDRSSSSYWAEHEFPD